MNGREAGTGTAPHELALLAGGPRAAVTVAVVALHLLGAVETGPDGALWATGPPRTEWRRSRKPSWSAWRSRSPHANWCGTRRCGSRSP